MGISLQAKGECVIHLMEWNYNSAVPLLRWIEVFFLYRMNHSSLSKWHPLFGAEAQISLNRLDYAYTWLKALFENSVLLYMSNLINFTSIPILIKYLLTSASRTRKLLVLSAMSCSLTVSWYSLIVHNAFNEWS